MNEVHVGKQVVDVGELGLWPRLPGNLLLAHCYFKLQDVVSPAVPGWGTSRFNAKLQAFTDSEHLLADCAANPAILCTRINTSLQRRSPHK